MWLNTAWVFAFFFFASLNLWLHFPCSCGVRTKPINCRFYCQGAGTCSCFNSLITEDSRTSKPNADTNFFFIQKKKNALHISSAQLLGLPEGGKDRGQGPGEGWHSIHTVSLWQVVPAESSFWPGITNPLCHFMPVPMCAGNATFKKVICSVCRRNSWKLTCFALSLRVLFPFS